MSLWEDLWSWIWTFFLIFAYLAFLFALIFILIDLFTDHSVSGWGKAGWLILLVFLPFIGGLIYLITRGSGMSMRLRGTRVSVREDDDYSPRRSANPTQEIAQAAELRDKGIISQGEFEAIKNKALTGHY